MKDDQQALDRDRVHYREVLHELEVADYPKFQEIVRLKANVFKKSNFRERLSPSVSNQVSRNLAPIIKICRRFDYEPVIVEFSLILDERLIRDTEKRFFVSLLYFALKGGGSEKSLKAADTYAAAMDFMNSKMAGNEPIIPHPDLYLPKNGSIVMKLPQIAEDALLESGASHVSESKPVYSAYKIPFIEHDGKTDAAHQVNIFLDKLIDLSKNIPEMSSSLSGLRFMLLPIVRPEKRGGLSPKGLATSIKKTSWGVPAGSIFLFLKPPENEMRRHYVELTRALRLMVTRSCLHEMSYAFDDSLQKEALFGGMVHGTVNAIRSIGASELCNAISYRTPPETPDDLNIRIFSKHEDKPDDEAARELILALNHAVLGEDTAAMLLSFSEMQLSAGIIRQKFQNDSEVSIDLILTQAVDLVNANAARARAGDYARVELVLGNDESQPLKVSLKNWIIPKHYLNAKIIRGLFSELLRNASQYGKRKENTVTVTYNFRPVGDEGFKIEFTNQTTKEGDEVESEATTSGFLSRTQTALIGISGIKLEFTRLANNYYRSSLVLGKITAQLEGNGSTPVTLIQQ